MLPPWFLPPLLLAALWWFVEAPLHHDRKRMRRSVHDRSTIWVNTILIDAGLVSALALMPWARAREGLRLAPWLAWGGLLVVVLGALLRHWCLSTLGRFHTGTLQVQPGQEVVDRGPYRLVRHPSYLGADVAMLGVGMTTATWPTALLSVLPSVAAHVWRIPIEERMMRDAFGERWHAYARRTWRMIPYVW